MNKDMTIYMEIIIRITMVTIYHMTSHHPVCGTVISLMLIQAEI